MMCFHKGPLVLRHALVLWTPYFSNFLQVFSLFYAEFVYVEKYLI